MRKQVLTVFLAGVLTASMSMTALAGWEQEETNWKYNDNGVYAANGWYWIDGNNDGVAESYYFDNTGILARDTTVEGYTVNADGAWTVNGTIQTKIVAMNNSGEAANTGNYDSQYPLAGMLDQLGLNFAHQNEMDSDLLYWSNFYQNWTYGYDQGYANRLQKAKESNNLSYYYSINDYDEMLAIAKLAGRTDVVIRSADEAKAEALANNIRDFFRAFPNWKTASDYEKACHIARWIEQADYDENYGGAYNCLVNKKCACSGYWAAANLLAHCVGLEAIMANDVVNHAYPVFNINGVWLGYDAASSGRENNFYIYDVYHDGFGDEYNYFMERGYVVPTSLRDKFDSSLIKSVAVYGTVQDALKLQ